MMQTARPSDVPIKSVLAAALVAVAAVFLLSSRSVQPVSAQTFPSGSGTAEDPYIIESVDQLQAMRDNLTAHYALGNDIDASITIGWNGGAGFEPVGNDSARFTGSLYGRGYAIKNLRINRNGTNDVGLFGYIGTEGVIDNVRLENVNVNSDEHVGSIAGINLGTVSNCYSTGSVSGKHSVGGLVGVNAGTVSKCYSSSSVTGSDAYVGGLVGYNLENMGVISNSYATGTVTGDTRVGGLVGYNAYNATISNSYATGSVVGNINVGGLVGRNYGGTISTSYSTGPVKGKNFVGGLVGFNTGTVSNCYSIGSVTGEEIVGGLVGGNIGTVSNCYSIGSVTGEEIVGGLVGGNIGTVGTVSNSFWDRERSGLETSSGGTGKTTAEMKDVRTYTAVGFSRGLDSAWDFMRNPCDDTANNDIWDINITINEGYPFITTITESPPETQSTWTFAVITVLALAATVVITLYHGRHRGR